MKYAAAAWLIWAPLAVRAAEPLRMADAGTAEPRFYALDKLRNNQLPAGDKIADRPIVARALRSDAAALSNGFMRIDRARAMATVHAPQHPLVITPSAAKTGDTPRIILGAAPATEMPAAIPAAMSPGNATNPVLSLFNSAGEGPTTSFRDALAHKGQPGAQIGAHRWPLPDSATQKLTSGYGYRADPIDRKTEFHGGIDIAAAPGTPVLASADGIVAQVGQNGLYGQSISLQHADGSETHYGHLSRQNVKAGDRVKAGDVIGAVGATGRVTGPHLDYRMTQNGVSLNPMQVLSRPGQAVAPVQTAAADTHVYPSSPMSTRPRIQAKSERLIVVR